MPFLSVRELTVNDLNRLRRTVVPFILLWRRRFDVRLIVSDSCESAAFFVNPQTREVASARLRPSLLRRFAQYFFCLTGRGGGGRGSIVYPAIFWARPTATALRALNVLADYARLQAACIVRRRIAHHASPFDILQPRELLPSQLPPGISP